jgi:ABC-2 type transport system ATP-binding protein
LNDLIARSSILVIASHSEALLASMCNRCLLLEHGGILADGPAQTLLESYRASVIQAAQADDAVSLHRAYVLATEMARRGEKPPLELEEQGLRYALTLAPDDAGMWQRYVSVLVAQRKPVAAQIETRMILTVLANDPSREDLIDRLKIILAGNSRDLPDEIRERANARVFTPAATSN